MRALVDHHLHLDSPLHRWHPVCKWLAFLVCAVAVTAIESVVIAAIALGMSLALVSAARLPGRLVVGRLLSLAAMLVILVLMLGATSATVWRDGAMLGVLIALKCLTIVTMATVMLATTATSVLFNSLGALGVPRQLLALLTMSFRMVFAVGEEAAALRRAATCRGYRMSASLRDLGTFGRLTGSLLVRSVRRSDRLFDAMLLRGYDGRVRSMSAPRAGARDMVALIAVCAGAAGLAATRWAL